MFFIMKKKGQFFADKRKYRPKPATVVARIKDLEEARTYIEDTSLYIDYGASEIKKANKELENASKRK